MDEQGRIIKHLETKLMQRAKVREVGFRAISDEVLVERGVRESNGITITNK